MNRRESNEKVKEFIQETANKVKEEMRKEYKIAEALMWVAEDELVKTLDQSQIKLYEEFCQKRKKFFQVANNCYTKNI